MWFKKKAERTAQEVLIQAIIQEGLENRKMRAEIEARAHTLEMRRLELEMDHIEALGEEKRKDAAERERLRETRRQNAANARKIQAEKRAGAKSDETVGRCKVCLNPADPTLSTLEIQWHSNGHREGPDLFAN